MPDYNVCVQLDCNVQVQVKANSPEEAASSAYDKVPCVGLCHACAEKVNVGESIRATVFNEDGDEVFDDDYFSKKNNELTKENGVMVALLKKMINSGTLTGEQVAEINAVIGK